MHTLGRGGGREKLRLWLRACETPLVLLLVSPNIPSSLYQMPGLPQGARQTDIPAQVELTFQGKMTVNESKGFMACRVGE